MYFFHSVAKLIEDHCGGSPFLLIILLFFSGSLFSISPLSMLRRNAPFVFLKCICTAFLQHNCNMV